MRPKTIIIIGLILVLIYIAATPIGQLIIDIGHALTSIGHSIKSIGTTVGNH